MIALDSSVIIAILRQEREAERFIRFIDEDENPVMSAANVLECSIVMRAAKGVEPLEAERRLNELFEDDRIEIRAVTVDQLQIARAAHIRFGKGTGHGAALNFGDCFAYALAKSLDVPLLYKGDDFARTDIVSALA